MKHYTIEELRIRERDMKAELKRLSRQDLLDQINSHKNYKNETDAPEADNIHELYPSPHELQYETASSITPSTQKWLWPGVIPLGTFTLFAGVGGVGKSQLLLEIASKVSTGNKFDVGGMTQQLPKGKVLILNAEDCSQTTVVPRLMAAGADLSNIAFTGKLIEKVSRKQRNIDLSLYSDLLSRQLEEIGDVKLIIIDPIQYYTGHVRDHITTEVADFLCQVNEINKKFNTAMIINKHLRKQASGTNISSAVNEVGGSGAWVNSARQAFIITRSPDNPDVALMCSLKTNITKNTNEALAYSISSHTIYTEQNHSIQTSKLTWSQEIIKISADEAVNKELYDKSRDDVICDFIINYLKDHGRSVQKILVSAAEAMGFKIRTIRRVLSKMKSEDTIKIFSGVGRNVNLELVD